MELLTTAAVTENVRELIPAGTVCGVVTGNAAAGLLVKLTDTPPAGAGPERVSVPVVVCPENTLAGVKERLEATGAVTMSSAVMLVPPCIAVIVTFVSTGTGNVVIVKAPLAEEPAGITTGVITVAAPGVSLLRMIFTPPAGAGPVRVTIPVGSGVAPPATEAELKIIEASAVGITVRVEVKLKLDPELALTKTGVTAVTGVVASVNDCMVLPAGIVTPAGGVTSGEEGA